MRNCAGAIRAALPDVADGRLNRRQVLEPRDQAQLRARRRTTLPLGSRSTSAHLVRSASSNMLATGSPRDFPRSSRSHRGYTRRIASRPPRCDGLPSADPESRARGAPRKQIAEPRPRRTGARSSRASCSCARGQATPSSVSPGPLRQRGMAGIVSRWSRSAEHRAFCSESPRQSGTSRRSIQTTVMKKALHALEW